MKLQGSEAEIERVRKDMEDQIRIIREEDRKNLVRHLEGQSVSEDLAGPGDSRILEAGTALTPEIMVLMKRRCPGTSINPMLQAESADAALPSR